jgi:hypothetical protein
VHDGLHHVPSIQGVGMRHNNAADHRLIFGVLEETFEQPCLTCKG